MTCEAYRRGLVDDDADRRALERHARSCEPCRLLAQAERRLQEEVVAWRDATPPPAAELEAHIASRLAREGLGVAPEPVAGAGRPARAEAPGGVRVVRQRLAVWVAGGVLAAAATLGLALLTGTPWETPGAGQVSVKRIVQEVEDAERAYLQAIARLERRTGTLPGQAPDASLPAGEANRLLAYRDRLAHLDGVIEEVRRFLDEHPGHSGGHAVLLAAYREKVDVLRELARRDGGGA